MLTNGVEFGISVDKWTMVVVETGRIVGEVIIVVAVITLHSLVERVVIVKNGIFIFICDFWDGDMRVEVEDKCKHLSNAQW